MKTPNVRAVLKAWAEGLPDEPVAVFLSAGIDSTSVAFALEDAGRRFRCYTFGLAGRESTDVRLAKANAATFGWDWNFVPLPTDDAVLFRDLYRLAALGARTKTDFECMWPMLYAYAAAGERIIAAGVGADGHFCISKKGILHWRDRIDDFRRSLFASPRYCQKPLHAALCARTGKAFESPYLSAAMVDQFLGTTWEQVNKPRQKQPIRDAYADRFARMRCLNHMNLQLGDSGIADLFAGLPKSPLCSWSVRSATALYNRVRSAVAAGEFGDLATAMTTGGDYVEY